MSTKSRSAFTLIELLVVVAIIATLMALLLPALQKVREAANRMRCAHNLKQLGIAMHGYHGDHNVFPPSYDHPAINGSFRYGWATLLLPYVEQSQIFKGLDLSTHSSDCADKGTPGRELRDRIGSVNVPALVCPSSELPAFTERSAICGDFPFPIQLGHYVAIMGAPTNATDYHDPTGRNRVGNCVHPAGPRSCGHGYYAASNGVIFHLSRVGIRFIKDGTSNTIIMGEQSDWGSSPGVAPGPAFDNCDNGTSRRDPRTAKNTGIWTGSCHGVEPRDDPEFTLNLTIPCWEILPGSMVTVRWPINQKSRVRYDDGMANYGWNQPIQSVHPGGAHVLRCDGSTLFLAEETEWEVLRDMAIRDDGKWHEYPE